jgi:import inner membrane translocase subunit TIM54
MSKVVHPALEVDVPVKRPVVPATPASLKALEHTGLPPSLLRWKPKLPSRNWSIFLTLVGTVSYAYYYDRTECSRLKKEYMDRVKYLAEEKIEGGPLAYGRKVTVYAAKWPEDDEWERGLQYFKRYVKVSCNVIPLRSSVKRSFLLQLVTLETSR